MVLNLEKVEQATVVRQDIVMKLLLSAFVLGVMAIMLPTTVAAQEDGPYKAGIWIDPHGCEHWVLDFGVEGMMSPHLDREGNPVCGRNTNICMEFASDTLFASGSAVISSDMAETLTRFFAKSVLDGRPYFLIAGHTDNVGDDFYNYDLGRDRATAVAMLANQTGAVTRVDTLGEKRPIASNDTEDGRRRNRRVEIICN